MDIWSRNFAQERQIRLGNVHVRPYFPVWETRRKGLEGHQRGGDKARIRTQFPPARAGVCCAAPAPSFYCTRHYHALQKLFFTNWRSVAILHQASLLVPFSSSICLPCVSAPRFVSYGIIFNVFIIIIFAMVICDLWCNYCKKIMIDWKLIFHQ